MPVRLFPASPAGAENRCRLWLYVSGPCRGAAVDTARFRGTGRPASGCRPDQDVRCAISCPRGSTRCRQIISREAARTLLRTHITNAYAQCRFLTERRAHGNRGRVRRWSAQLVWAGDADQRGHRDGPAAPGVSGRCGHRARGQRVRGGAAHASADHLGFGLGAKRSLSPSVRSTERNHKVDAPVPATTSAAVAAVESIRNILVGSVTIITARPSDLPPRANPCVAANACRSRPAAPG